MIRSFAIALICGVLSSGMATLAASASSANPCAVFEPSFETFVTVDFGNGEDYQEKIPRLRKKILELRELHLETIKDRGARGLVGYPAPPVLGVGLAFGKKCNAAFALNSVSLYEDFIVYRSDPSRRERLVDAQGKEAVLHPPNYDRLRPNHADLERAVLELPKPAEKGFRVPMSIVVTFLSEALRFRDVFAKTSNMLKKRSLFSFGEIEYLIKNWAKNTKQGRLDLLGVCHLPSAQFDEAYRAGASEKLRGGRRSANRDKKLTKKERLAAKREAQRLARSRRPADESPSPAPYAAYGPEDRETKMPVNLFSSTPEHSGTSLELSKQASPAGRGPLRFTGFMRVGATDSTDCESALSSECSSAGSTRRESSDSSATPLPSPPQSKTSLSGIETLREEEVDHD